VGYKHAVGPCECKAQRAAQLAAPAPELYQALKIAAAALASRDPQWWRNSPEAQQIRAAIANAEAQL